MERIGIKIDTDSDGKPIKEKDYSKNLNYLKYFNEKLSSDPKFDKLIERIYNQFIDDTSPFSINLKRVRMFELPKEFISRQGMFSSVLGEFTPLIKRMVIKII